MSVVFVHHADVIEDVLAVAVHAFETVVDDDCELVVERGVVGAAVWDGRCEYKAVTVLMLKAFARKRRASRGAAHQKAARLAVARRPGDVADALKPKHRIEDVEGDHRGVVVRVRGRGGGPRRDGTRFGDAFLQDLSCGVFLVPHDLVRIDGIVELPFCGIDAEGSEQPLHPKRARFVGHDGNDAVFDLFVAGQGRQHSHERHGGRKLFLARAFGLVRKNFEARDLEGRRIGFARGQVPPQCFTTFAHVLHLGGIVVGFIERRIVELIVGDRDAVAVAKRHQRFAPRLLERVRDVDAFARFAEAVPLSGFRQDDSGLAGVRHRLGVGGVDLRGVMAAAVQCPDLVVRHVGDHLGSFWVLAKEVFAHVGATLGFVVLIVAVDRFFHALEQHALLVFCKQAVPTVTPNYLDDVPTGSAEIAFEFLNDLRVAAHGPVESLQVAVDHKDQIVELFSGSERDRATRFGLVHFAVAEESPDLAPAGVDDAALVQVLHEAGLVDRHERAQPH